MSGAAACPAGATCVRQLGAEVNAGVKYTYFEEREDIWLAWAALHVGRGGRHCGLDGYIVLIQDLVSDVPVRTPAN